ncbi:hypothetical protein ACIBI9_31300 [Nonomuraea sp. NPDC050451]|uniref:hypothetical protein n=1 Tax=Nonomuraea sp. NPDC050451 TaxID=3364364 RepID=UPI00378757AF
MAVLPNPRTWTVGELLTAAKLNTDLRDGLNFLLATKPLCKLKLSAGVNLSSQDIPWSAEDIDRDNGHSTVTNTTRYTAQTAGWYSAIAAIEWVDAFTTGEARLVRIGHINSGGSLVWSTGSGCLSLGTGNNTQVSLSGIFPMAVGDYLVVTVVISGAGTELISNSTSFSIEWINKTP